MKWLEEGKNKTKSTQNTHHPKHTPGNIVYIPFNPTVFRSHLRYRLQLCSLSLKRLEKIGAQRGGNSKCLPGTNASMVVGARTIFTKLPPIYKSLSDWDLKIMDFVNSLGSLLDHRTDILPSLWSQLCSPFSDIILLMMTVFFYFYHFCWILCCKFSFLYVGLLLTVLIKNLHEGISYHWRYPSKLSEYYLVLSIFLWISEKHRMSSQEPWIKSTRFRLLPLLTKLVLRFNAYDVQEGTSLVNHQVDECKTYIIILLLKWRSALFQDTLWSSEFCCIVHPLLHPFSKLTYLDVSEHNH